MPFDLRDKVGQGHRLGLEIHAADGDALAAVAFEGMGGEGDDGDVARSVLAQYLGRRFPSVHFAERDVHEDDVGLGALRELNPFGARSEEHTSELQSLMRISYAVFCLKKNNN